MLNIRPGIVLGIYCATTLFGLVRCQLNPCEPRFTSVYLTEGYCDYLCPIQKVIYGTLLCKEDGHTVVRCPEVSRLLTNDLRADQCTELSCEVVRSSTCNYKLSHITREVRYIRSNTPNVTVGPIYIHQETKPNNQATHIDRPWITSEEPTSQTYMYGILSFFFGVIAFFIFAIVFRFLYRRFQRQPVHVHTFSGHQLPVGSLHLRTFLSPSPYPPQISFPHNEQVGIPGLDLPPSYIVASELLDPPPSYEDISKPKGHSAQIKVTSL